MGKVANVITMLELLANGRKYNIEELAERLEVTPRMIRSYKEALDQAGIYIDSIRGPYGGYVLNQTIRMPKRKFSINDYKLILGTTKDVKDEATRNKLIILADKIHGIYQGSKEEQRELLAESNDKYNAISRAIKESRKVKILYYSYNKGENERVIRPYDMFIFGTGWGCAAFCETKQDLRHFELKRISNVELMQEYFE